MSRCWFPDPGLCCARCRRGHVPAVTARRWAFVTGRFAYTPRRALQAARVRFDGFFTPSHFFAMSGGLPKHPGLKRGRAALPTGWAARCYVTDARRDGNATGCEQRTNVPAASCVLIFVKIFEKYTARLVFRCVGHRRLGTALRQLRRAPPAKRGLLLIESRFGAGVQRVLQRFSQVPLS